jgi:thiol-disulfide isomerase/thioredoxin
MPHISIGTISPDFNLKATDNNSYRLSSFSDKKLLVITFTCNHCPFVKAYEDRLIQIQKDYSDKSVSLVAINSNETINYPEDTFEKMQIRVTEKSYNFPYLRDEDQSVASSYGASFTPEIFVFDIDRKLRYHGRIDDNKDPDNVTSSDLRNALDELLSEHDVTRSETHGIGCSIKWAK